MEQLTAPDCALLSPERLETSLTGMNFCVMHVVRCAVVIRRMIIVSIMHYVITLISRCARHVTGHGVLKHLFGRR